MSVVLVPETLQLPKEMNEIRTAIRELVADIKAGKEVGALAGENLQNLIVAVEGFDKLDEEAKSQESYAVYGLLASDLAKILSAKK